MEYTDILSFWFDELTAQERFNGGQKIDDRITEQFADIHQAAIQNELWTWRETPAGALAEIIVLDQFSRNLFRGQREAFAADAQALALAQVAREREYDQAVSATERLFFYLPYMHSESPAIHDVAVTLFTALGDEEALAFEHVHKDIIEHFGRYPHRNAQLGRTSTPEEELYLKSADQPFFAS